VQAARGWLGHGEAIAVVVGPLVPLGQLWPKRRCKYLNEEEEDPVGSGGPRGGGSDIGLQQRQWPSQ